MRFSTAKGSIEMTVPAKHLIVNRYSEEGDVALAGPLLREMSRVLRSGRPMCIMNDAEQLTDYDSGFRQQWTEWLRQNRSQIKAFHLLHGSGLVRVGANLANVVLGDLIKGYADRTAFDAAVSQFLRSPP